MKALKPILIGAAIIGLAVATGGISLAPSIAGFTTTVAGSSIVFAGVAGGLATTALGSIALTIGASMAISGITGALAGSPKVPASQIERLNLSTDPKAFRKTVLGRTAFPLDIRFQEWWGTDQAYCDLIIVHAAHRCHSLDEIWINDELAWSGSAGGVQGKFVGYFWMLNFVDEGSPSNVVTVGSGTKWDDGDRLTGCCYSHVRFKVTGNSKKAESPFSGGVPIRMTFEGHGGLLYDPRRDSTVPGGSGPFRAADQSTWAHFAADGNQVGGNLPLQILRVLQGWTITNPTTATKKLSVGCGLPAKRLHLETFCTAANLAEEQVTKHSGGTETRYFGAITLSEGDDPAQGLDAMCAACNGKIVEIGGKLGLIIAHNDLAAAATDPGLNDDDVISGFVWNPDPAIDQCPNVVSGDYTDPSSASLYQQLPYPEARVDSVDGIDRSFPLDLTAAQSPSHASRVASQVLERKQYDRTFTATFDIRAWIYGVGDVVPFIFAPLSFNRRLFRVTEQEIAADGKCQMTLREESTAIYAWDGGDGALVTPAAPNVYDSRNSAIIQGIGEAGGTANWPNVADTDPVVHPRPEDGSTDGAILGTTGRGALRRPDGSPMFPSEVLNTAVTLGPDGRLIAAIEGVGGTVNVDLGRIKLPDLGAASDSSRRQLDRDLARLSGAVAQLAAGQQIVREVFRDAGLYTDPASGIAKLFAIERRAEQISTLSVTLNAALASINLKASVDYVNTQIAAAVFDPSTAGDIETILVRLTSAEVDIDGLTATIALKADATTLTTLSGTVTSLSTTLSALDGLVSTKASQTQVTAQDVRLTSAETSLSLLGDSASITAAVSAVRLSRGGAGKDAVTNILGLLSGDNYRRYAETGIATARQDLNARVDRTNSAVASLTVQLAAQIGATQALIATETTARVDGDQASATALAAFQSTTNGNIATINTSLGTLTTAQGATAASLASYTGATNGNIATINTGLAAVTTAQSATASDLASYKTTTNGNIATINTSLSAVTSQASSTASSLSTFQTSVNGSLATINTALVAQSTTNGAVAGLISTINTTLGGHSATLASHQSSIDGLQLKWGVEFDVDGRITGFVINGGASRTDAIFRVDSLKVVKAGLSPRTVFAIGDDGNTYILGKLFADSIEANMLKVNTAVVPGYAGTTAGTTGIGITNFITIVTKNVTLAIDGVIEADINAQQSFLGGANKFRFKIYIDGTLVRDTGEQFLSLALIALTARLPCAAGASRQVRVDWAGSTNISLDACDLRTRGFNNTSGD